MKEAIRKAVVPSCFVSLMGLPLTYAEMIEYYQQSIPLVPNILACNDNR